MKLLSRFIVVLIVVGIALAAQTALTAHLGRTNSVTPGRLAGGLDSFPMFLDGDAWEGKVEDIEENLRYGDDHLKRTYTKGAHRFTVWMIYSSRGKDREHHPEVCLGARGVPEDASGRKFIDAPGDSRPVQQYRYGHVGARQYVYYWHYRLPSGNTEGLNQLQRIYRESKHPPASITAEIFAPEVNAESEQVATEFMLLVDAELRKLVGPGAIRGNDRKPVSFTPTTEQAAQPPAEKTPAQP